MKYQLVIQKRSPSCTFDELVALQRAVDEQLGDFGVVDGNDIGSGEMDIFVLTDDPVDAFKRIQSVVTADLAVAYREIEGETWTVLFPPGRLDFEVL